ncbi:MAG: hypothetical protein IIW86_03300 [Clostridia bacterium]|nr:hypothetical protein [Clostridia bacterium]
MVNTPHFDLDIDSTLGGDNASDYVIPSQKAIKDYVDNNTGSTVDQTYDPTSQAAQSGVAIAGAGFLTSASLTNYVTTNTEQTITAKKTFNTRVNFLGSGDANAIYLSTDTRIDVHGTSNTVLGFANGTFLINNAAYNLKLRGKQTRPVYNSDTNYIALLSDVPTDTGDLTNNAGYIKGITSSDVTTALGFTPYSAANPNNYTSVVESTVSGWGFTKNAGTVTSVNNVSPVNGNVSLTIPTVNDATLTIQKNGTDVQIFSANASSNVTANITVPTAISDLTDDTSTTPIDKADTLTGLTASVAELNYVDGVTSAIQTQIDGKADTTLSNVSSIDSNSAVQTALDGKVAKAGDTMTGNLLLDGANFQKKGTFPTSTPSANTYINGYEIFGNDTKVGAMAIGYLTSGNVITRMFTQREVSGTTKYSVIDAGITSSGLAYCSFPNTTCVDGRWIPASQTIVSDANVNGSSKLPYTLNLPNDGYDYEVIIVANIATGTTSGNAVTAQVTSDLQDNWMNIARARTRTASAMNSAGTAIVPVSSSHKLYLTRDTGYNGTVTLYMRAYRRLGTNS